MGSKQEQLLKQGQRQCVETDTSTWADEVIEASDCPFYLKEKQKHKQGIRMDKVWEAGRVDY